MDKVLMRIIKFNEERNWAQFHSSENLAKSISIEAAELLECFQWSENAKQEKVEEELADVLIYCLQLADKIEVDVEEIIMNKLAKNEEKYPIAKAKGNSKKYTEFD